MSPASHDDVRAAAALVASAACDTPRWQATVRQLQAVILDGLEPDRCASIACVLAAWLAQVLREGGTEPKVFALQAIAESIRHEAEEGAS